MGGMFHALMGLCFAMFCGKAFALSPKEFDEHFSEAQVRQQTLLKETSKAFVNQYDYVMVTGFLNEALVSNFTDWMDLYHEAGVSYQNLHLIKLSSNGTVRANARELQKELRALYRKTNRQMILIAHSKGAVESLVAAVDNPDFWLTAVKYAFLIQGPFGGCYIADYVQGDGVEPGDGLSWWDRLAMRAEAKLAEALGFFLERGLKSVTSRSAQKLREDLESKGIDTDLKNRIFFGVASEESRDQSDLVAHSGEYLNQYYGESDGLILLEDQALRGFGRPLNWIQADHLDLVMSWPVSNTRPKFRRAFALAVLSSSQR